MLKHSIIFMFEFQFLAQPQKEKSVPLMSIKHRILGFRVECIVTLKYKERRLMKRKFLIGSEC